jgi:hypothetical protein
MPDLEVGMTIDELGLRDMFNTLLEEGVITVDEMNDILSKIGFTPDIEYEEITLDDKAL